MVRAVGPLDKRRRTIRCQACARRRIKCDGEIPCKTCVRLKKPCLSQQRDESQHDAFIPVTAKIGFDMRKHNDPVSLLSPPSTVHFTDHFFSFLASCNFTNDFSILSPDLLPLVQSSLSLSDIASAIGALVAARKGSVRRLDRAEDPRHAALLLYGRSIRTFSEQIAAPGFQPGADALWTTFLLGLFELMSEAASTDSWSMHMIQGMGPIVQRMPQTAKSTRITKELLEIYRCLEINRTILYGSSTIIRPSAVTATVTTGSSFWALSQELMLEASDFSHRMFVEIQNLPCTPPPNSLAIHWSFEGVGFLEKLREIRMCMTNPSQSDSPFTKLAQANCCALCLYICLNFTYFPCFATLKTPRMTDVETEETINTILGNVEDIARNASIPGLLLLFPLRIAGASAGMAAHRTRIEKALRRIHSQGFAVAEWVLEDLHNVWTI